MQLSYQNDADKVMDAEEVLMKWMLFKEMPTEKISDDSSKNQW